MRVIFIPTVEAVVVVNKFICEQGGNPHHVTKEELMDWFEAHKIYLDD